MEDTKTCPSCETELPTDHLDGLCPRCLLEEGVQDPFESPGRRFIAPPPYEIAPEFPDLEILGLLGQGGMGAVYRVRHAKLGRDLALKIVPKDAGADAAFPERFLREAKALSSLSHPGIVLVTDFGEAGAHLYLLMEFVDGPSLRGLLGGGIDPARAVEIAVALCRALAYAHDHGIVHRDVKPENVLVDETGHVSVVDFGLVKLLADREDLTLTQTRQILGTPHYMAPEQIERPNQVDHRVDVYALGVLLYEMLTGRLPLGRFPRPSEASDSPAALDGIVLRALAQDPADRYASMEEFREGLERPIRPEPALSVEQPVEIPPPPSSARREPVREKPGGPSPDRQPKLVVLLALTGGILLFSFFPWASQTIHGTTLHGNGWQAVALGGIPMWIVGVLPAIALAVVILGELMAGWRPAPPAFLLPVTIGLLMPLVFLFELLASGTPDVPDGLPAELVEGISAPRPGIGLFLALSVYVFMFGLTVALHRKPSVVTSRSRAIRMSKRRRMQRP
jgi:serine/threonine protein kinase